MPSEAPTAPMPHVVRARRRDTADTFTLDLAPVSGQPVTFVPGQFNMLYAFGVGEVPVSVSGMSPGGLLHTVRAVGAVTTALCRAGEGSTVGLRGPYGRGWQLDAAVGNDVVIVAGGVGLAPLRHAVHLILAARHRYGRVMLIVGARSDDVLLYRSELDAWAAGRDLEVHLTVDHGSATWRGSVGLVLDVIPGLAIDPARTVALLCGPEVMMRLTSVALVDCGVPPDRIQVSLERNMKCAVARCGHCQLSPLLLCRDGPVLTWDRAQPLLAVKEL